MAGITDLVAILMNNGMSSSGNTRVGNALEKGGLAQQGGLLEQIMGAVSGGNTSTTGGSSNDLIGSLINVATSALSGGGQGSASGGSITSAGIGALTDAIFGGNSGTSAKGSSSGGGAMAILAGLAFQAFKNMNKQPAGLQAMGDNEMPLGLRAPVNEQEEQELENTATLILRGMINAAKSDGQIGNEEIEKIMGRIKDNTEDENTAQLILQEMQKPLDLDGLVRDIPNEAVAAQVYAASLFAIEVDTPAERQYLEQFVQLTGLDTGVAQQLHSAVGIN